MGMAFFFPYSVKTSKCSDSCNNIHNPLPKFCARDVVKNLNSNESVQTNETRRIE